MLFEFLYVICHHWMYYKQCKVRYYQNLRIDMYEARSRGSGHQINGITDNGTAKGSSLHT
jgi:hypothetical protein